MIATSRGDNSRNNTKITHNEVDARIYVLVVYVSLVFIIMSYRVRVQFLESN